MLRATAPHGAPWSWNANSPRVACTYWSVVTTSGGPVRGARGGPVTRGNVCRPSGNVSTTMRQSLISTVSISTSRCRIAPQVSDTSMRLATSHGGSVGSMPSMRRSSTTNRPLARCTPSRPIVILRSSQLPPARSARARSAGPRSIVTDVTSSTASVTATPTVMRRPYL